MGMGKESKKAARRTVRAKERADARDRFPLDPGRLRELFDRLDELLGETPCDHSLRLTRAWLAERGVDATAVVPWLEVHGGYCDCEVLANVEEHVDDALHDEPER